MAQHEHAAGQTDEAWLTRLDRRRDEALFFMACAELFGYD